MRNKNLPEQINYLFYLAFLFFVIYAVGNKPLTQPPKMVTTLGVKKKVFTPAEREAALALVTKKGYTMKEAADEAGCSLASLTVWKKAAKNGTAKKGAPKKKTKPKAVAAPSEEAEETATTAVPTYPSISFAELSNQYWMTCLKGSVTPKEVQLINEVLYFAHRRLVRD